MKLEDVKEYFVTYRNLMKKLKLSNHAYLNWRSSGYIPYHHQVHIEEMTGGVLKANIKDKKARGGLNGGK